MIYYLNKQNNKMRYAKGFSFLQEGNGLQSVSLNDWCEEYGVEKPLSPVAPHVLTEQEYYASLPIKEM